MIENMMRDLARIEQRIQDVSSKKLVVYIGKSELNNSLYDTFIDVYYDENNGESCIMWGDEQKENALKRLDCLCEHFQKIEGITVLKFTSLKEYYKSM